MDKKKPVIAIFDVGKTNKKLFLFDQEYRIVHEEVENFAEVQDEDGFPCEDLEVLSKWVKSKYDELLNSKKFILKAVNFSAYGASFIHLDKNYQRITPLYNYLKPYPPELKTQFYNSYGGEENVSLQTASPVMGHLNSGLQLYWLKFAKPEVFKKTKYSLHLPQYLSFLLTGKKYAEISYIGSHSSLWDFQKNNYHRWVTHEKIFQKLPPIRNAGNIILTRIKTTQKYIPIGIGIHDSSAALIPYMVSFSETFLVISTGTWCISLNPFNHSSPTSWELKKGCLCYLTCHGKPVKASMLFAGNDHQTQVQKISEFFNVSKDFYRKVNYNQDIIKDLQKKNMQFDCSKNNRFRGGTVPCKFASRNLAKFKSPEHAYHQLIFDIIKQQVTSTKLVLKGSRVKKLFVDGGFCKNIIYMNLLSIAFPNMEVFSASMAQATALGAALVIHNHWNKKPLPNNLIELNYFATGNRLVFKNAYCFEK